MMAKRCFFLLCGVCAFASASAEPLGRLFFTPEQRSLLERQREEGANEASESRLRLDGWAARRNSGATRWINGRVESDERLARTANLRVGESIDLLTGSRQDVVPDGSIVK
jgi:hypothetical protein